MSASSTPNDSPINTPIQPLHNPSQAAHIVVPQAPLGNVANQTHGMGAGMGAKALLAKKLARNHNPNFTSPTDNLMTPVTQKLNAAKKKQFNKGTKPLQLFAQQGGSDDEPIDDVPAERKETVEADAENPF